MPTFETTTKCNNINHVWSNFYKILVVLKPFDMEVTRDFKNSQNLIKFSSDFYIILSSWSSGNVCVKLHFNTQCLPYFHTLLQPWNPVTPSSSIWTVQLEKVCITKLRVAWIEKLIPYGPSKLWIEAVVIKKTHFFTLYILGQ